MSVETEGEVTSGIGDVRDRAGDERDDVADARDGVAERRDRVAEQRDEAGAARDEDLELRDRSGDARDDVGDVRDETAVARDRAGALRDAAADGRIRVRDRDDASVDSLTGVSCRAAGFLALDREIARATRSGHGLLVGFVDVDGLKQVNDTRGHAAGDRMLCEVADALRAKLRAYDLVFRYGGDEFVCALSGADGEFGDVRISLVNAALATGPAPASVTAGFAELRPGESSAALVGRADAALYAARTRLRGR